MINVKDLTPNDIISVMKEAAPSATMSASPRTDFDLADMSVEEFTTGIICLGNNITVNFRCSWSLNLPEGSVTKVAGDKGGVVSPDMEIYKTVGGYQSVITPKVFDNTSNAVSDWGHWVCYERILDDLDGKADDPVTHSQMRATAAIPEAVYTSAEQDREITAAEIHG